MHGYGYILGHSDHSAFTAQVLLAVFSWLFFIRKIVYFNYFLSPILGPILSPILGPVQGPVHVLYYALAHCPSP